MDDFSRLVLANKDIVRAVKYGRLDLIKLIYCEDFYVEAIQDALTRAGFIKYDGISSAVISMFRAGKYGRKDQIKLFHCDRSYVEALENAILGGHDLIVEYFLQRAYRAEYIKYDGMSSALIQAIRKKYTRTVHVALSESSIIFKNIRFSEEPLIISLVENDYKDIVKRVLEIDRLNIYLLAYLLEIATSLDMVVLLTSSVKIVIRDELPSNETLSNLIRANNVRIVYLILQDERTHEYLMNIPPMDLCPEMIKMLLKYIYNEPLRNEFIDLWSEVLNEERETVLFGRKMMKMCKFPVGIALTVMENDERVYRYSSMICVSKSVILEHYQRLFIT